MFFQYRLCFPRKSDGCDLSSMSVSAASGAPGGVSSGNSTNGSRAPPPSVAVAATGGKPTKQGFSSTAAASKKRPAALLARSTVSKQVLAELCKPQCTIVDLLWYLLIFFTCLYSWLDND